MELSTMNNVIKQLEAALESKYNIRKGCLLELERINRTLKDTEDQIVEHEQAVKVLKNGIA